MTSFAERFYNEPFPWDVPRAPTIVRDPELAAVLAELQRVRNGLDRIEDLLIKPKPPPPDDVGDFKGGIPHVRNWGWWWQR